MTKWTQERIAQWSRDTFGEVSVLNVAIRMNREMGELITAVNYAKRQEAEGEIADLGIFLYQLAHQHGVNLQDLIDAKMEINLGRKWELTPAGDHQHAGQ